MFLEPSRIFFIAPQRHCYWSSWWPRAPGAYGSPQPLLCRFGVFLISPFFLGHRKPSVLFGSLQIQLLGQCFSNLYKEQEPFGSFVLLWLGSTLPLQPTSRGRNHGMPRSGFDSSSSAPPGQGMEKLLVTGIYLTRELSVIRDNKRFIQCL